MLFFELISEIPFIPPLTGFITPHNLKEVRLAPLKQLGVFLQVYHLHCYL
jgi:hypothetical protein